MSQCLEYLRSNSNHTFTIMQEMCVMNELWKDPKLFTDSKGFRVVVSGNPNCIDKDGIPKIHLENGRPRRFRSLTP